MLFKHFFRSKCCIMQMHTVSFAYLLLKNFHNDYVHVNPSDRITLFSIIIFLFDSS